MSDIQTLREMARQLRNDVLDITAGPGGHVSSAFSAVELLTAMYFGGVMRYRPDEPNWPERDRFLLSKGHAAPVFYPVLARAGYVPLEKTKSFRQRGSGLHGHPIQGTFPGIENTSGSLGQGLSIGLGHVLAGRLSGLHYRVNVLLGDGECEEGQIWEAAMAASHFRLDRLVAVVDLNRLQATGAVANRFNTTPVADKWRAFGWHVTEIDGHDMPAILDTLDALDGVDGRPKVIVAHTVKGKGVSFMENTCDWHGVSDPGKLPAALEEVLAK